MTKLSPLQRVRSEHGSKAKLAEKVLAVLDVPADEDKEDFEARIKTLSNAKLLRLHDAHKRLADDFGSRDELIEKIVAHELRHPVDLEFQPEGVRCTLLVPVRKPSEFELRRRGPGGTSV